MKAGVSCKLQRKLRRFGVARSRSDGVHGAGTKRVPMLRRTLIPLMAAVLMASAAISPAHAQRGRDRDQQFDNPFQRGDSWDRPRDDRGERQRKVPLSEVKDNLEARYGGGQLLGSRDLGTHYEVEWLTPDGRKLKLRINAATGRQE
jgi:uncharacterized membrane protein YkoI